jgi:hypothetical protein
MARRAAISYHCITMTPVKNATLIRARPALCADEIGALPEDRNRKADSTLVSATFDGETAHVAQRECWN